MQAEASQRWRRVLAAELLAYGVLIAGFLWVYVVHFHEPVDVIHRHVALIATALVVLWGVRVLAWRVGGGRVARTVASLLMIGPFCLLLAWYALVVVGLDAWGRIPTWPLIRTYLLQAPALLAVLGFNLWLVGAALILCAGALTTLVWRYLAPHDWANRLAHLGSAAGTGTISVSLMLVAALLLRVQTQSWVGHPREPVALGFLQDGRGLQSHLVRGSVVLDAREDTARGRYQPDGAHAGRNLVVIVGDALRSEHMSLYGYGRETTPKLATRIKAGHASVVPHMRSACAESSCGLMAIAASRSIAQMSAKPLTLQEVLKRHGYAVHFILGGDHTNFYGLKEMYGELDSYHDGSGQRRRYMNDDQLVLDQLEALPLAVPGQAVAFQFHLMSTHGLGRRDPMLSPFQPAENYYRWPGPSPKRPPSPAAAREAVNYYDNGMVRFDHTASRILDLLQEKGYLEDALVVVTGDHGEMLGERGLFSHQHGLSESVLDIPLVLLRHGYAGREIPPRPWSGQIDVAPTILHELGLPAPEIWQGRPLQEPWTPRDYQIQQAQYFGIYHINSDGRVLKYVRDLATGQETVTDPVIDPKGMKDLSDQVLPEMLGKWRSQSMVGALNSRKSE